MALSTALPETPPQATQTRRAVIVDDDPGLLRLVSAWLEEIGYVVEAFHQFEPAKRRLAGDRVDVLVTDVRLGAFNGLQLVVMAKLAHPDLIAIVLTGFEDPVLRREALDAGALFLAKPLQGAHLQDVVRTYSTDVS